MGGRSDILRTTYQVVVARHGAYEVVSTGLAEQTFFSVEVSFFVVFFERVP